MNLTVKIYFVPENTDAHMKLFKVLKANNLKPVRSDNGFMITVSVNELLRVKTILSENGFE